MQSSRKISLKNLRKKAWRTISKYVRNRDKRCVTCTNKSSQAGHFIHKDCLDFDERNINGQCKVCNLYLDGNMIAYNVYMLKKHGQEVMDELRVLGNKTKKFTRNELEEIIEKYGG